MRESTDRVSGFAFTKGVGVRPTAWRMRGWIAWTALPAAVIGASALLMMAGGSALRLVAGSLSLAGIIGGGTLLRRRRETRREAAARSRKATLHRLSADLEGLDSSLASADGDAPRRIKLPASVMATRGFVRR